ncbi:MAG: efflux RND transporter periplasmic adaptor subunit [Rubritepida sp.]|nr:efflux RND transporter periplasmic adaptor subunit [Rubritepida sp.]
MRSPLLVHCVFVTLALMLSATPARAQFGPAGPPAVGVVEARRQPVMEFSEFIGRVESISRVDIRARVTGFLEERRFREGTEVPEGALLFRLERAPFEAQLEQARASLASAEAQLANARVTLARARELRATGAGTQVALDNAQAQERVAAAALLGAEAQVRVAEINLAYTDISAPIAGAIGRSTFTPGNVVSPTGEALATIISQDPMRVAFTVSSRTAGELTRRFAERGGMPAMVVRIRFSDGVTYDQAGRIDFIDPTVNGGADPGHHHSARGGGTGPAGLLRLRGGRREPRDPPQHPHGPQHAGDGRRRGRAAGRRPRGGRGRAARAPRPAGQPRPRRRAAAAHGRDRAPGLGACSPLSSSAGRASRSSSPS